ncbi:MAG: FecR family protein [Mangrovibacterium sp.]
MTLPDLLNYFSGKASVGESKKIADWMKDPENEAEVRGALGKIWTHADIELKGERPDFESLLERIHRKLQGSYSLPLHPLQKGYRIFSRVAAVLIFPLLFVTIYLYLKNNDHVSQETSAVIQQEIYTKPGTRSKITLSDGTLVWLHDGTTLRYPERFGKDQRRVFVDGEAYFEVVSDPDRPFIVQNPMMETLVTGTKFNLNAYSSDQYFEATLIEGKIELKKGQDYYQLEPRQQVRYDDQTGRISEFGVNPYLSTAWIQGKLIMQDEPLSTAVKKISRWYNVKIILQDCELHSYFLTATIENEKPEQTMKLISMALPVDFTVTERKTDAGTERVFRLMKR